MRRLPFLLLITALFSIGSCKPISFSKVSSGINVVKTGFSRVIIENLKISRELPKEEIDISDEEDFLSLHLFDIWNLRMMIK